MQCTARTPCAWAMHLDGGGGGETGERSGTAVSVLGNGLDWIGLDWRELDEMRRDEINKIC